MGCDLWWVKNDGIGGHAWLDLQTMRSLREEMLAQGMASESDERQDSERASASARAWTGIPTHKFPPRERETTITSREIAEALQTASWEPQILSDRKLWRDWLEFLDGATRSGGILVRP